METRLDLFSKIPENFFSILSGNLKGVHTDLLYLVYEHYKRTIYVIEKEVVIDLFIEYLETNSDESNYSNNEEYIKDVRDRAHHYLLKFCQHGWLRQEQYLDYKYRISIPDYASKILDTFGKIAVGYQMEFSGTVLAIYQNISGPEGDTYFAIQQAYENTLQLVNGLKELNHNIKRYIENLMEQENAKEVLEQLFNEYGEKILGKHYYRLKTSENVSKYRTKIIDRIRELRHKNNNVEKQALIMLKEEFSSSVVEAENQLYLWLDTIEKAFEYIYEILDEIDERNRKYHRAAMTQIKFHIIKTGLLPSKINRILTFLAAELRTNNEEIREGVEKHVASQIDLFKQGYIDSKSLKLGADRKPKIEQKPIKSRKVDNEIRNKKIKEYQEQLKSEVTVEKINNYVNEILVNRKKANLTVFPYVSKDDYVNLIFTVLHSTNNKTNYRLTLNDNSIKAVKVDNGIIPNMKIELKGE